MDIYDYTIKDGDGNDLSLKEYRGKVVLIVNTATGCGFTPQYKELQRLYDELSDKGFDIIDIPCNQFGGQAPGTHDEIKTFCELNYNTTFPQMMKSDVNGDNELPLYTFLKSKKSFESFGKGAKALAMSAMLFATDKNYKTKSDIKWNFTKFLIDRAGNVIKRFEPTISMSVVEEEIKKLI